MAEDYQSPGDAPEAGDDVGMELDNPTGEEGSTALIPTDFFQGRDLKPGSECKVRVRRLLKGQAEVEYVGDDDSEPDPGDESEPAEGEDEEMSGYMNQ